MKKLMVALLLSSSIAAVYGNPWLSRQHWEQQGRPINDHYTEQIALHLICLEEQKKLTEAELIALQMQFEKSARATMTSNLLDCEHRAGRGARDQMRSILPDYEHRVGRGARQTMTSTQQKSFSLLKRLKKLFCCCCLPDETLQ